MVTDTETSTVTVKQRLDKCFTDDYLREDLGVLPRTQRIYTIFSEWEESGRIQEFLADADVRRLIFATTYFQGVAQVAEAKITAIAEGTDPAGKGNPRRGAPPVGVGKAVEEAVRRGAGLPFIGHETTEFPAPSFDALSENVRERYSALCLEKVVTGYGLDVAAHKATVDDYSEAVVHRQHERTAYMASVEQDVLIYLRRIDRLEELGAKRAEEVGAKFCDYEDYS